MAMKARSRLCRAGLFAVAASVGLLPSVGRTAPEEKNLPAAVLKLAEAIEEKDTTEVQKQTVALARQFEVEDWMRLFALRRKNGIGVGATPGFIMPDGIEAKLLALSKKLPTPREIDAQSEALVRMG